MTKSVKTMIVDNDMKEKFKRQAFYNIRGVVLGDYLRVSKSTVVLDCGPFPFDSIVEREFLSPLPVTVAEALASPKKRRISVSGHLSEVSGVYVTENSRKKILKLTKDGAQFQVKLWGRQADITVPPVGTDVTVTCIDIGDYRGATEGNSSCCTTVEEVDDERAFSSIIDAATFEMDKSWIVLEDNQDMVLRVDPELLQGIFPDLKFRPNVRVPGQRNGSRVLTLREEGTE